MEHFINIVMDKQEVTEQLDESVFPNSVVLETAQDVTIYQIPLDRELTNEEADEYAQYNITNVWVGDRTPMILYNEYWEDWKTNESNS